MPISWYAWLHVTPSPNLQPQDAIAALDEKYAGVDHWHRFEVDRMLLDAGPGHAKVYGQAAKALVKIRDRYERAGDGGDFATYLEGLREQYDRRPSLMAALDRAGL